MPLLRSNEQKITKRDLMRTRLRRFTRATPEKQEEKDMQKTLRTLKVVLIAALLGASAASSAQQGLSERWQTFGAPAPGSEAVNPGWAGAMFYRSGGGITINSVAEDEYRECLQKIYIPQ